MTANIDFRCKISQSLKEELNKKSQSKGVSLGDFISELFDFYHEFSFLCDNDDLDHLEQIQNLSKPKILQEVLLKYGRKHSRIAKKGIVNKADQNIASIVNDIMQANEAATNLQDVIYINQTSITKWFRTHDIPLMNFEVIKRYLRLNSELLDEHHKNLNITANHNRDSFFNKKKSSLKNLTDINK